MKQGYMVGYSFNRYNTLQTVIFFVNTTTKKQAQDIVAKWCKYHKKEWGVYKYGRCISCKITEKNVRKYASYTSYELSWDRLGGTYRVWETGNYKGAIV